jgi:hypothetical protein
MNFKLNSRGLFTTSLWLIILVFSQLVRTDSHAPEFCIRDLVKGYDFQGYEKPEQVKLEMCPMIKYSCCKPTDQVMMFKNWIIAGESKNLIIKFGRFQKIYRDVLDEALGVYRLAKVLTAKLQDKPLSNCKVMAGQIGRFDLPNLIPKLNELSKNFFGFLYERYKGYYCAICDAEVHKEIDLVRKEVNFSEKYCRDVVANSLHFLMYFHLHLGKYLNLQLKFLNFCDGAGNFSESYIDNQLFPENPIESTLMSCRAELNSPMWFSKCFPICSRFNMVELNDFFIPLQDKYIETYSRIQELKSRLDSSLRINAPMEYVKKTNGLRILASNNSTNTTDTAEADVGVQLEQLTPRQKKEMEDKMKENAVFKSQTLLIDLSSFKHVFVDDEGIDYLVYGRKTTYDEMVYSQMRPIVEKSSTTDKSEPASHNGIEDFSSKSVGRVSVFLGALILFISIVIIR